MEHSPILRFLAFPALLLGTGAVAQVAISPTASPTVNTRAILDLNDATASPKGFLIPRMDNAQRAAIGTPAEGLLVYQTNSVTNAPAGFYYWDADAIPARWTRVANGPGWKLGGNSNITAADFIGTPTGTAQPLLISTAGTQRAILQPTGQFQLGATPLSAATERLDVKGAVRISGTSDATPSEGAIRFNAGTGMHEGYVNNTLPAGQPSYPTGWYQLENVFKSRVAQRYESVPQLTCAYQAPDQAPSGAVAGSWPGIDAAAVNNTQTSATTETPYATFWEDSRHQYLYLWQDLQGQNVCPNTPMTDIAFQAASAGTLTVKNIRISMKNTTTGALGTEFETGASLVASYSAPYSVISGWNRHNFNVSPWSWNGPGWNMLVEFGMDNQEWTSDVPVFFEQTTFNSTIGARCDACANMWTPSSLVCTFLVPSGLCGNSSPGTGAGGACPTAISNIPPGLVAYPPGNQNAQLFTDATHIQCQGWGHTPGPQLTMALAGIAQTCDCTFNYNMAANGVNRHPIIKFRVHTNGIGITYPRSNYMLSQRAGVMVGDLTWANGSLSPTDGYYEFKGPGTIAAQSAVWGGGVLLSDHVFDQYYDGQIKVEDAQQARGYEHYPLKEMVNYVEKEHHLPTMAGRDEWNEKGAFSVDQLTNQLWVTVETQSLYIKELNDRMQALQNYLVEKRLKELKK